MKNSKILIFATILIMVFFTIGSLVVPDREFSENENRYLRLIPDFSVRDIMSGRYESQMEEYLSDQIIGRDPMVQTMSWLRHYAYGNKDINGAYIGKEGRLYKKVTDYEFNWDNYENNLNEIKKFSVDLDVPVKTMLVPTAAFIESKEFPMYANRFDEDRAFDLAREKLGDNLVQVRDVLKAYKVMENTNLYYYTDHHWTNEAVYVAYEAFRDEAENLDYKSIEPVTLTDDFLGTLYSKVLISKKQKDVIEVPKIATENYEVEINGKKYDSILFMDKLNEKDKYEVLLGGNYNRVDIKGKGEGSILIIKDSYANAFVPYLLDSYDKITLIDTRYFRNNIKDLVNEEKFDEVLVLYSIDTFQEQDIHLDKKLLS